MTDRNLYTALKSGYSGDDSLIHRSSVSGGNDTNLRTVRNDVAWLNGKLRDIARRVEKRAADDGFEINPLFTGVATA